MMKKEINIIQILLEILKIVDFGLRTAFFGITKNFYVDAQDVKEIPVEELKQIDIKIGAIKTDYNNIVFKLLANEVKNTNNFKKFLRNEKINTDTLLKEDILRYKIDYLNKLIKFRDKTAGPDEMKKFYKNLFSASVLDKFESKKFHVYEYVKEQKGNVDILSIIEINLSNGPIYYIYSKEEQTYIQMSKEEILQATKGYIGRKGQRMLIEGKETKEYE